MKRSSSPARQQKLAGIVRSNPIPFAYRIAYLTNFYREPLLREIDLQFGLSRPEWTVLICLKYQDGTCATDICDITEQPRNNISRAVNLLTTKKLITREPDPTDARRTLLRLTRAGENLYERAMPMFVQREAQVLDCLDDHEREQLDRLLDKLCGAVPQWRDLA